MILEERIVDLKQRLEQALINERQTLEVRLRIEGALVILQELLDEQKTAETK